MEGRQSLKTGWAEVYACSVVVAFIASPLEINIFSNMGYLLSIGLALFGYFGLVQKYHR